ncbi:hypothetical protein CW304_19730 [Bacillus sp. UFRGS-B20]|nr:hypothetical protein CW304_19730 [Bacillus sp. UFRGS-B20]
MQETIWKSAACFNEKFLVNLYVSSKLICTLAYISLYLFLFVIASTGHHHNSTRPASVSFTFSSRIIFNAKRNQHPRLRTIVMPSATFCKSLKLNCAINLLRGFPLCFGYSIKLGKSGTLPFFELLSSKVFPCCFGTLL